MRSHALWATAGLATVLLTGCATASPPALTPSPDSASPMPNPTAAPTSTPSTLPALPEPDSDDAIACTNVNRAVNFLFTAAAESAKYTDDPERVYRGSMALLFAGYDLDMSENIATDLGVIVEIFSERAGTTTDGVQPYWDVAKAYVDAPDANPLTEPLDTTAETCDEAGYTWKRWSVDS